MGIKHFVLIYEFAEDYLTRRAPFRGDHLALAWGAVSRGELQLGGALVDEPTGLLVFKGESAEVAEAFARQDPYVLNGVVRQYRIREWVTVVGRDALHSA